jgi:predicted dehydrogenase
VTARARLGFLGVGWIGRARLEAVLAAGVAQVAAVADVVPAAAAAAAEVAGAAVVPPAALLDDHLGLDGVVIATPSGQHAEQAVRALDNGLAVFCQKPLGRDAAECAKVVDAAEHADRLLGVDMCYRELAAVSRMRDVVASGRLGEVYAADLVFHNAYGPDKAWYTDPALSAGGCVIDLGIHLVDLALWLLDAPGVVAVTSRLFAQGQPVLADGGVEDHGIARLDLASGAAVTISCSWFLPAGTPAVIGATFYGRDGSVALANVDGSFYDFVAFHNVGTSRAVLAEPPDEWGGRAIVRWARGLATGGGYDPAAARLVTVASVLDRVYGR